MQYGYFIRIPGRNPNEIRNYPNTETANITIVERPRPLVSGTHITNWEDNLERL